MLEIHDDLLASLGGKSGVNKFQSGDETRWYDKDTRVLVYRKLHDGRELTLSTKLLKYNAQPLSANEFELPKGYEVRDLTK